MGAPSVVCAGSSLEGTRPCATAAVGCTLTLLFGSPGFVDRCKKGVQILVGDVADEEYPDVMLDRHRLGIIDARLLGQFLVSNGRYHLDCFEAKRRLAPERLCGVTLTGVGVIDDTVLLWLDSSLAARLPFVSENRPDRTRSARTGLSGTSRISYTQMLCP